MKSFRFCSLDAAGTATTSDSDVSRAIGVTASSVTADLLVRMAPTITSPITMRLRPSPLARANSASPMVPPAPPLFSSWIAPLTSFSPRSARSMARPVWSQPPPGFAGIRIFRDGSGSAAHAAPV